MAKRTWKSPQAFQRGKHWVNTNYGEQVKTGMTRKDQSVLLTNLWDEAYRRFG